MTVRDLLTGSLRLIGAVASGETPPAADLVDAMSAFNDLLDSLSAEGLVIPQITRESFALISGQASYTMGTNGTPDFNSSRPIAIEDAKIELLAQSPTAEVDLDLLNDHEWADLRVKSVQSTIPTKLHARGTYPNETLDLWPVPTTANNLILYTRKPLANVTGLSDVLTLPPGYNRMLRYNAAVECAPEYGKAVPIEVATTAARSLATIKRRNSKPRYLQSDAGAGTGRGKRFNILTGE